MALFVNKPDVLSQLKSFVKPFAADRAHKIASFLVHGLNVGLEVLFRQESLWPLDASVIPALFVDDSNVLLQIGATRKHVSAQRTLTGLLAFVNGSNVAL